MCVDECVIEFVDFTQCLIHNLFSVYLPGCTNIENTDIPHEIYMSDEIKGEIQL